MDEHRGIFGRWLARTVEVLDEERRRMGVEDSRELGRSLSHRMEDAGDGLLRGRLLFLTRGRFVDMGAGRGAKVTALSRRRAKQWYSPAFYGRINTLMGAMGLEMMEHSMETLKSLEDGGIEG